MAFTTTQAVPHNKEVTLYVMLSGVLGGLFITIAMAIARLTGLLSLNLERSFGTLLLGTTGPGAWLMGLILHLAISAIFALIYAEGFRRIRTANWKIGAAFGIVHWMAIGVFIGLLPSIRPMMATTLSAPGAFASNSGAFGFIVLLLVHLVFGAMIGIAFERMLREHPEIIPRNE